jgi:hypothetical protein
VRIESIKGGTASVLEKVAEIAGKAVAEKSTSKKTD